MVAPPSLENYSFPSHRFNRTLRNPDKTPLVLVGCGSFSPVTYLHLRMFEMAVDYVRQNTDFEIMAGYLSPVNDSYKKPGLLSAQHRVNMCTIATEQTSSWLMVDPWEAYQEEYQRTAVVLDHFDHEINDVLGGVTTAEGEHRRVRIMLLAGSDLISTMSEPGVWSAQALDHILGRYGTFIVERTGTDIARATEALSAWRHNIFIITQLIQNDVSSTKVRLFIRRGFSVRYLLPAPVVSYIEENGLYLDEGATQTESGKTESPKKEEGAKDVNPPSESSSTKRLVT